MTSPGTTAPSSEPSAPLGAPAQQADRFEAVAATIAPVIGDEASAQPGSAGGQTFTGEVLPPEPGWTPEKVAEQFNALFTTARIFRGPHWEIDNDKLQAIGELWCPIFQQHVPYTTDNSLLQWAFAAGALVGALKEPLTIEVEQFKKRKMDSTRGDSTTAGSPASRGSSASLALERVTPPKN